MLGAQVGVVLRRGANVAVPENLADQVYVLPALDQQAGHDAAENIAFKTALLGFPVYPGGIAFC